MGGYLIDKFQIRREVLHHLQCELDTTDEAVYREIDRMILKGCHSWYGSLKEKKDMREEIFN